MMRTMMMLALALSTGCTFSWGDFEGSSEDGWFTATDWDAGYNEGTPITQARLDGAIGRFSAHTDATWGYANAWDNGFMVQVHGEEQGVVMTLLDVGGVDLTDLRVGDTFQGSEGYGDYGDEWIYMIGCGGEEDGYWEEDYTAEEVEVEVVEVEEEGVVLNFEGTLDVTGQEISSTVLVPFGG